jgi:CRISPR/Cas system-associated exonuclease Cas4 (RecB family)
MANVNPLPPSVDRVEMPDYFSVSRVSREVLCDLKLALSSTADVPSLPVHPSAEVGRLLHELFERAAQGRVERFGSPEEDARRELKRLLTEAEERLREEKATRRYARLSETMTPLRWRRKTKRATRIAARRIEASSSDNKSVGRKRAGYSSSRLTYRNLGDVGRWTEVTIRDEELRLVGRMDLVEKDDSTVVIRDFKTGRVANSDGDVRAHIKRQLRLYGLMAKRATPAADVRLVVDDGREHEVSFDREDLSATERRIRKLIGRLPEERTYDAAKLAQPGKECATCSYRHVCEAYMETAPSRWQAGASYPLPPDVGGTVENVVIRSEDLLHLELRDEADRQVKVFDLARDHLREVREGDELWFFGLRTYPRSYGEDRWHHPLNFFEVPEEEPAKRAWSLRIYGKPRNARTLPSE